MYVDSGLPTSGEENSRDTLSKSCGLVAPGSEVRGRRDERVLAIDLVKPCDGPPFTRWAGFQPGIPQHLFSRYIEQLALSRPVTNWPHPPFFLGWFDLCRQGILNLTLCI